MDRALTRLIHIKRLIKHGRKTNSRRRLRSRSRREWYRLVYKLYIEPKTVTREYEEQETRRTCHPTSHATWFEDVVRVASILLEYLNETHNYCFTTRKLLKWVKKKGYTISENRLKEALRRLARMNIVMHTKIGGGCLFVAPPDLRKLLNRNVA